MDQFELKFAYRLREELDAADIRLPPSHQVRRAQLSLRVYGMIPSLAVALLATLAIVVLASAFTGSTNPTVWVKPAVWMKSLGISDPTPSPSPSSEPEEHKSSVPGSESTERDSGDASAASDGHESPEQESDDGDQPDATRYEPRSEPDD